MALARHLISRPNEGTTVCMLLYLLCFSHLLVNLDYREDTRANTIRGYKLHAGIKHWLQIQPGIRSGRILCLFRVF